jgi:hypothetical protein
MSTTGFPTESEVKKEEESEISSLLITDGTRHVDGVKGLQSFKVSPVFGYSSFVHHKQDF